MTTIIIKKGQEVQAKQYSGQLGIDKVIIRESAIIGKYAFEKCTGITEVNIAEGATIGYCAFMGCEGITEVTTAKGTTIGNYAFQDCTGITYLNIGEGATLSYNVFISCSGITKLHIPKATTIRAWAFADCKGITELNIAKGAIIGDRAFAGCTGITELNIAKGAIIGDHAFEGCTGITEMNIAEGAIVNQAAFENCTIPLVHLGVNNTDLDKCIHNVPLDSIERRLSFNAQLVKDKVKMMTTYLQLLKLETTIPVGLVYCYRGQGNLSHLRYLSREVKNKIIQILCCFKNHEMRLHKDIVLNHIIAPPNVEIKLYYNSIEPSEDNFAKKEISATHWLT